MGMPSINTWVCSLRNPRVKTDVNWPAVPVSTTARPGTSRRASLTRSICFCSKSSEVITLALAGDSSRGISKRVAETTIASASASLGEGVTVGAACWPKQTRGASARSTIDRNRAVRASGRSLKQTGRFNIQFTSNSERVGLVRPVVTGPASPSSHSPFCEEVFAVATALRAVRRCTATWLQNEVDRTNILAPGFVPAAAGITFFPPSPSFCGPPRNAFGAQPQNRRRHACHYNDWPCGKSYPGTAAQLLPTLTGFRAPIHFSSSQRTVSRSNGSDLALQGFI